MSVMGTSREAPAITDWRSYPASGARHLQGCYVNRDELLSRIHALQR